MTDIRCDSLKSISFPVSLESIGYMAFCDCDSLLSLSLPVHLKSIGGRAFYSCHSLKSLSLPDSLESVGDEAFYGCESLQSLSLPESLESIGDHAFYQCESLRQLHIPAGLTHIGDNAFSEFDHVLSGVSVPADVPPDAGNPPAPSITVDDGNPVYDSRNNCNAIIETASGKLLQGCSVTIIPAGVTKIGEEAFYYSALKGSVTIPEGVTEIGNYAFHGSKITALSLPSTLISIGDGAISSVNITALALPDGLRSIGRAAFGGCDKLTAVNIPAAVTFIDDQPFVSCRSLTSLTVDENNTVYDSRDNCNAIIETASGTLIQGCNSTRIPSGVTAFGDSAFEYMENISASIVIPEGVTDIPDGCFCWCYGLQTVYIPHNVESIRRDAFWGCKLQDVYYYGTPSDWEALSAKIGSGNDKLLNATRHYLYDGYEFTTAGGKATITAYLGEDTAAEVPAEVCGVPVTAVADGAFGADVTEVTIPGSVTQIGDDAFASPDTLTICGCTWSCAMTYADSRGIAFVPLINSENIGDLNGDGGIDVVDATIVQYYLAGYMTFTDGQATVADADLDGCVTVSDVTAIQRSAVGLT